MAFPFILESNFEAGTNAEWTSETDSGSQLDFPHITELARWPWPKFAPYRGAYCARFVLGANTTTVFLTSTAIDIADTASAYYRWYMYFAPDFAFTADDVVSLFKLRQAAAGTVEYTVGISCTAATNVFVLGASDGTAAATFGATPITLGQWHCIEVGAKVDTGGTGFITTWLDGVQQSTETSKTQAAAVGDGDLGVMDRLATTTGTILLDAFVNDDLRLYPLYDQHPQNLVMTKSATVFVGPGCLDNISLASGAGTDCVVTVYDTSWSNTLAAQNFILELKNTANSELVDPAGTPVEVTRGCYVQLAGTTPRAIVKLSFAPTYGSPANARAWGLKTKKSIGEGL